MGSKLRGPASCTLSGSAEKGGPECCLLCSQSTCPSVFCAARRNSRFPFGNTALQPARSAGPTISVIHFLVYKTRVGQASKELLPEIKQ